MDLSVKLLPLHFGKTRGAARGRKTMKTGGTPLNQIKMNTCLRYVQYVCRPAVDDRSVAGGGGNFCSNKQKNS